MVCRERGGGEEEEGWRGMRAGTGVGRRRSLVTHHMLRGRVGRLGGVDAEHLAQAQCGQLLDVLRGGAGREWGRRGGRGAATTRRLGESLECARAGNGSRGWICRAARGPDPSGTSRPADGFSMRTAVSPSRWRAHLLVGPEDLVVEKALGDALEADGTFLLLYVAEGREGRVQALRDVPLPVGEVILPEHLRSRLGPLRHGQGEWEMCSGEQIPHTFSLPHASAAPPETPTFRARRRFRECLVVVPAPAR